MQISECVRIPQYQCLRARRSNHFIAALKADRAPGSWPEATAETVWTRTEVFPRVFILQFPSGTKVRGPYNQPRLVASRIFYASNQFHLSLQCPRSA